ncbi:MAG TPA: G5 domain-containing protein, partial [Candidatus Saccharimonadales bacterium]|nr:G5 domain-containing protein [Candidatus Saccharimonadales bacterium]
RGINKMMMNDVLKKLWALARSRQLVAVDVGAAVVLLVALGLIVGAGHKPQTHKTGSIVASNMHSLTNKPTKTDNNSTVAPVKKNSPAITTGTQTIKTTVNDDGTTTKEISTYVAIAFSSKTENDVNLKRGTTEVRAGQNGVETIVYSVTYDQNGNEISRKTTSDTVTKQPVTQITKVGVSDFNLNTDMWDGTEFGEMCVPADYGSGGDGCVGTPSDSYFGAVEISSIFYVNCMSDTLSVCKTYDTVNVQPVIMIHADSTFSYQGVTYQADPRAGGGASTLLTASLCSQYGLACGRW